MSLQLPFGVAPVNPVPVDAHSGPYTGVDLSDAVASANSSIASGVRFQSMEVRIVVSGVSYKYWYNSGTANSDLTPFSINDNTSYINTVSGNLQTQITDNSNDINTVSGLIVTNSADSGIELVGSTFIMGGTGSLDKLNITSIDSNQVPLTIKGAAAQAEKLQEWQDSSANVVAYIDKDGNALFSGLTALGDLDVSGTLTFIHSTNVTIADKQLELASNSGSAISGDAYIDQGGIVLKSINGDKEWIWRDSTDAWTASDNIDVGSNSVIFDGISQTIAYTGQETNVSGYFNTVSGNLQSQITSNDSDITTLQTATGNLDARVTQNASNVTTVSGIAQGAASDVTTASGHLQTQITANDSDINTVSGIAQGASSDVATASGHLQTQITSNDSDITALQTATGNLDTRVTQNASDVATASGHLQTQITANDSDINTVSGIAQGASSDVATASGHLQTQITSNDSDITALQTATGNLDTRVTQNASDVATASGHLQTQITANDSDINTVSGIAQGASSDVATASGHLQTQITANDSDITALQTATGNLDTRVTQNASNIATASGHLQTQITANDSDINTVSGIAQGASSDVATASGHLQTQITANDSDITALQTATGNLDTRVTQNASDVATASGHLQTQITANDSDINTVSGIAQGASSDVATASGHLQTQITANDSDITALQTATGNLDTRVTQNASNIATASGHLQTQITANDSDINTVSGIAQGAASDVATASGHLQTQITANDSDINTVSGIAQGAVSDVATASGHLQTQITANDSDINTVSGLLYNNWNVNVTGNSDSITSNQTVTFTGAGLSDVSYNSSTNTVTISGQGGGGTMDSWNLAVNGDATSIGDGETVDFTGQGDISILRDGNTVKVSGGSQDLSSYATTSYVNTVSGNLQSQITLNDTDINIISGVAQGAADDVTIVSGIAQSASDNISTASGHLQTQITANDSDINTVSGIAQGAVSDVATASGHLQTQITANDSDITALQTATGNLDTRVTQNASDVATASGHLQTQITANDSDINTVSGIAQGAVSDVATASGHLQTQITANDSDITALQTATGNLDTRVTQNASNVTIVSGIAQGAASDVATASGHLQTQITANDSDINTVSGIAQGAASDVATASGHLQTQITSNDSDITALQTATGNLDTRVTQNASNVTIVSGIAQGAASDVATASGHLQTQITANDSDINTVSGIAQGAASDVATASGHLQTQITSNDSDITALQTATGNLDTRVTQNASNVTIVSGIAQGAADDVTTVSGLIPNFTADSGIDLIGSTFVMGGTGNLDQLNITSISSSQVPLTIKGAAAQSANLQEWQSSAGTVLARIDDDGIPYFHNIRFDLETDDNIFLTTDSFLGNPNGTNNVAIGKFAADGGSGTSTVFMGENAGLQSNTESSFIGGRYAGTSAGQSSNLLSKSVLIGYNAGSWHLGGTNNVFLGQAGGGLLGIQPSGDYNIYIGTFAGSRAVGNRNIEILTSGITFTSILDEYNNKIHIENTIIGDTSSKLIAIGDVGTGNLTPDATLEILPAASTNIGLIVQGAASQNANLQEWQNTVGTTLAYVDSDGNAMFSGIIALGDLEVSGDLTYISSTNVTIVDKQLELASNSGSAVGDDSHVDQGGIVLKSTNGDKEWIWRSATDSWTTNKNINVGSNAVIFDGISQTIAYTGQLQDLTGYATTGSLNIVSGIAQGAASDVATASGHLQTQITSNDSDITALQTATGNLDTRVTQNASNVTIVSGIAQGAASDVATASGHLQTQITSNDSDITALQTATGNLDTRVTQNASNVTIVSGIAQGAASDVATASGHLQTQITSNDSDITALQTATGNLDTRVTQNASNVTIVSGIAQGAASDVATASGHLQTQITSNDSDITALQTATGNLDTRVTQNANDIDTVSGVAYKTFAITNNGSSDYIFDGMGLNSANDPTIYLHKGHTYYFDKQIASHPFRISATDGGSVYQDADGNNIEIGGQGILKFEVPQNAPDKLYYFCTSHPSSMKGEIYTTVNVDDIDIVSGIAQGAASDVTTASGHLQTQITSNDSDITTLQTATGNLDTRVTQNASDVATASGHLQTQITSNDSDITALQTATGNLDTRVTQNASDVATASGHLQTQITSNDSDITTLQTATGNLDTRVTQNASDVATASGHLQTQITSNDSDITTLQTATGVLRADIDNNDTDISTVSGLLYNHWVASDGSNSGTISTLNTLTFSQSGTTSIAYNSGTNTLTIGSTGAGGGGGTNWNLSVTGDSTNIGDGETVAFTGQGGVTLTRSSNSVIISGGGTTYTAGSGLVLDGNEFNVHGGSGNFQYVELKSSSQDPQLYFLGSGSNDTPITLNVLSSFQSASSSGSALVFDGTEGQLFAITDNLSSGVIFSVSDIAGLPLIEADASGDVKLIEFGRYVGVGTGTPEYQLDVFGTGRFSEGIIFPDGNRQTIAYTGGGGGGGSSPTGTASGVAFFGSDNNLTESINLTFNSGTNDFRLYDTNDGTGNSSYMTMNYNSTNFRLTTAKEGTGSRRAIMIGDPDTASSVGISLGVNAGSAFGRLRANNSDSLTWKDNGAYVGIHTHFWPLVDNTIDIGHPNTYGRFANVYSVKFSGDYSTLDSGLNVSSALSTDIPLVVQGAASQSANLQEWQSSAGTVGAHVDSDSNILTTGTVTIGNIATVSGQFIYGDSTNPHVKLSNSEGASLAYNTTRTLVGSSRVDHVILGSVITRTEAAGLDVNGTITADTGIFSGIQFGDGTVQTTAATGGGGGGGGSTSPGGSNTNIQFNNAGAFSGESNFTWDYNTDALTVSGSTLISNTGTVLEVTNTGGTTLFAVEDSDEVQVIVAKQVGQTGNPFEVRDEFDVSVASIDVSGNISGNNIIFGDGTVQTTAATGGGGGGMSSWNLSVTGDSTSITNGETIVFSGQDAITTTRDGNTVIISGAAGGGGGSSPTGTPQGLAFFDTSSGITHTDTSVLFVNSAGTSLYAYNDINLSSSVQIGESSNLFYTERGGSAGRLVFGFGTTNFGTSPAGYAGLKIRDNQYFAWTNYAGGLDQSPNLVIARDDDDILALRRGSGNPQEFRVYHSESSASNYSRLSIKATGNNYEISPQVNGDTAGSVVITNDTSSKEILVVKGAASQSANLQEWKRSDDQHLMSVDENGNVLISGGGDSSNLCSMTIKSTGDESKINLINYLGDTAYVHMQGGQRSAKFGQGQSWSEYGGAWHRQYAGNDKFLDYNGSANLLLLGTAGNTVLQISNYDTTIVSGLTVGGDTDISGALTATTKSFLIDHPTKEGMKLQYGSLEGPENGVYVRGTTDLSTIELPDYWVGLVDENSITVSLTPVGSFQQLYVEDKNSKQITVGGVWGSYDYVVYAERKDVDKLEVEW